MRIAAIVTVSDERQRTVPAHKRKPTGKNQPSSFYQAFDILGENLLTRTLDRLEKVATIPPIVLAEDAKPNAWVLPRLGRAGAYVTAWEKAVAQQIERGAEVLLFSRLNAYTDLDYEQLLEFHHQTRSPFTQVYALDDLLDVALVNVSSLGVDSKVYRKALGMPIPGQRQFLYRGYVNRLRRPQDYYKLVEDGLCGCCGLKPRGSEVEPGIWYGADAEVDPSATIVAPAFIGADSHIAACSTVSGASIESNCQIDCGTAVRNSWVLENTYIGLALEVRRAVVSNQTLFHLDRDVELSIPDGRLIGVNSKSIPLLANLESFFWGAPEPGA